MNKFTEKYYNKIYNISIKSYDIEFQKYRLIPKFEKDMVELFFKNHVDKELLGLLNVLNTILIFWSHLYGLSKKFNEELAEVYSNFYKMKFTGLRLFTVYGEWGRPDMFFYKYLTSSKANKTFYLNNFGNHFRDFTYIQDVVKIIYKLIVKKQKKKS